MGNTQSAQKEDNKDAAAEQEGTESDGVVTGQDADNQPLKSSGNFSDTNGKADRNVAACNGHFEDEIAAMDEDFPTIVESIKEEDTQSEKGEICQEYSPDEADSNENAQVEITEMDEKQNDINETFRKLFSNIKFKLTVKRGSTDNVEVTTHSTEQDPKTTEDIKDMANETRNKNAKPTLDHNAATDTHDTDSTTCPTLTDDTSDALLESGGENSPGTKEDIEADSADAVTVFLSHEEDDQKEPSGERWHSTASPNYNKEEEVTDSPFKSFFTTGIFSGLQKKKKELVNKQEREMEEITERAPQGLEQEYEITVGVEARPNDLVENEPKENIMCAPSPQLTDASPSISPSTYTVPVAEISSSQEDKVQASPLKKLLSGSSLKRLSRKPRSRRSSDGRLSSCGEHSSDHYLSSTESTDSHNNENLTQPSSEALKEDTSAWESFKKRMTPKKRRRKSSLDNEETHFIDAKDKGPQSKKLGDSTEDIADLLLSSAEAADNQKEDSGAQVSTKASDEGSAWSSFKKLMTPKKLVKKPSSGNEEKTFLDEGEIKPSKDRPTSDHSTEEEEKRKELSVSWEAVLCGSGKKRSSKKSESEKPQIDADTNKEDSRGAKSALERSNEINQPLTQSPNQAESFPECDEGLTWKSFKKLVTPKRRAKHEDEAKDYKEPDTISTQEETFSFRKLLSGKKIRPCVEKQELSPEVDGKQTSGDDEEFETPAVVPLSEFDTIETDIPLQIQANIERCNKPEAGNEIQQDLCEETPVQILSRNSEIEIESVTKSEPLPMEISKGPSSNEESDENTETSKHQQLSDIPEEGIITETMATPASVADEVTKDDTTAEDLIEITSEAITAPEPDDVSVTDETDMISAVSQLPESSKTSGNTTPVPVEHHQEKDTEMLLQQAAETIVTSTSAVQICSEKSSPEGIVHSLWKQILKTFRNEKSKEDETTIKMDLNEDAKDADVAAKTMIDMNKDISKEVISGVPTEEFDLAEIANDDDICQLQENCIETPIMRSEESQIIEKYLEETNSKTTFTEPSLQVEVVISDYREVAYQSEVQPSKTDSEKVQSAFTMTEETQDRVIEPKPQYMAGTDTPILSNINEEARMETEELTVQLDKKTELDSKINSLEQTEAMKPNQEAENITEVMATLDMQAEVPNLEETNRQLSKTEIPTAEEVSKEDLPSTKCKPSAKPHTEMSIDNKDKEPLPGYEDFDKVQKEKSDLSVLEEKLSEDATPFQTDENEDVEKIILSEDNIKPAYDFTQKPDEVVEDTKLHFETRSTQALQIETFSNNKPDVEIIKCETKSLAEASVKHQVVLEVLENVADTTLYSKAVCCQLTETKTILEVISATDTNEMEVHTEANSRAKDTPETGHGQETQVLEAGKDTVLEIGAGASHVIETKEMYEVISTAETSKNGTEAHATLNVRLEVSSEIMQTKELKVSEDGEASKFNSDICTSIIIKEKDISEDITAKQTVKEETHNKPLRPMMSQDTLEDTSAFKKEEEKNKTTVLHKSDNDKVFGPESDYGRELPKEDTALNLKIARFQLLEKEITPIAVSDGDEKTPFTEDNIDPMETIEKQKVSENPPEISSHPEEREKVEVSEVIKTQVIVGDGGALKAEANDYLVGEFKRQNAGEQDPPEAGVPAFVRDYQASELKHFKKDVISDTISTELAEEDRTISITGGNDEQVNAIKTKEVLILDSDPNKHQIIKNEEFSDSIQTVEPTEKNVSLINGSGELVIPTKTESIQETECKGVSVSILDSDPNNLQKSKTEHLPEVIQATQSADAMVALTDGNVDPVRASKTGNVSILDIDPNSLQTIKNKELSDGSQALTNGNGEQVISTKTENVQYSEVCEPLLALISDSEHNNLKMVKNEEISEGIQVKSSNKTESSTDGSGNPTSVIKSKDVQEPGECEAVSVLTSDSGQSKFPNINNENISKVMQLADETIFLTDGNSERVSATKTKDVLILDLDSKILQIITKKELSDRIQPAKLADETIYLTADTGELLTATQTGEVQEPEECEAGQMVKNVEASDGIKAAEQADERNKRKHVQEQNDSKKVSAFISDSDPNKLQMVKPENETISQTDGNGKPMIAPNIGELREPEECEAPCETVSLTDGKDEQVGSTKRKDVEEQNESKEISIFVLHSDPNNCQIVTSENSFEVTQSAEPVDETVTLTESNGGPVIATCNKDFQEPKECEAAGEAVSLTDGKDEQAVSTKIKDVQGENERNEISVFVLDLNPNNLLMVKNNDFRESTQAAEPANETIAQTDATGKPMIAPTIEALQEPKGCEAPRETVALTDGKDEQEGSTKIKDVQGENERNEISVFVLDLNPNNLLMVKNNDFRESTQAAEPANETIAQTDATGKPMIAPTIEALQEPKGCEAPRETVALTDGKDEQEGSTKRKHVQEQNDSKKVSTFILDSDPSKLQMVKPENETISQTDGNGKPMIAPNIGELQEPKECEAPCETVSLTDGKDEQVGSTKRKDVQEQNESKEISIFVLHSDPNNCQIVKSENSFEVTQSAEPVDETVTLTESNGGPVIATCIKDVQEPKECEAACETVSLTDGKDEQAVSTKIKDVQGQNERNDISVFVLHLNPNNLQMVKNNDFRESIQTAEPANETIAQTDGTDKLMIAPTIKELQEPKGCEAPRERVALTDGKDEQEGSTKRKHVQEQNDSKKVSAFISNSDPNKLQMVKPENETISQTDGNGKPMIAPTIEELQEPKECEAPCETVSLTDGKDEQVGSTKRKDVQEQNESKEISIFVLHSDPNNCQIVTSENAFEVIQSAEPVDETVTLTESNGGPVIATCIKDVQEPRECEAAGEAVSLTDGKDEQAVSTKIKDVQGQNERKDISVFVLDLNPNNLQMVKNNDFRETIQAAEPANETIAQTDGTGKPMIAPTIEELQEPKGFEAPCETVSLTDGKDEQVGSTKRKDVQEQNESKEISIFVLHSDPNNYQIVTSENSFEVTQSAEPVDETVTLTESNDGPVIATCIKDVQEPKVCEAAGEAVSLTDGKDEQAVSTKSKDVQEQNERKDISDFVLDLIPNNLQMVKPENETIAQTDGNGKPMIGSNIKELQEPKECEAPCDTVSLTDGKDEQVGSTKRKDVQEQNESKEIPIFVLHSDPNKLHIVTSENAFEVIQSAEPVDETVTLTESNGGPVIATCIKDVQEPKECEAAGESVTLTEGNGGPVIATCIKDVQEPKVCEAAGEAVSLTDGKDEQAVSTKSKDVQEQNERKDISDFVLDLIPNNLQMVKPENETIAQTDGNGKPMIGSNIKELQEPKECEAPCDTVSLTDGKDEQVGSTKRKDVQEQNESKEIPIFVLHSDPNKLHIVRSENSFEITQSAEPVDETATLTEGNGGPVIATYIKEFQEPKECEAAGEAVSLTDGKDEQVVSTKSKDVQEQNERKEISDFVLDLDPNNLQMVINNYFREGIQAAEPTYETISHDGNGKPVIAPNIVELQAPKECEAAVETVSLTDGKDEQVVSTKTKDVQEKNESKKVSALILDSQPKNLQMAEKGNFFEGIQTTEAVDETVSLNDGNGEPVISTETKDLQEQKEDEAVLALILDSGANKFQMIKNKGFREYMQVSDQADQVSALNEGNGEPVSANTTKDIQEQEEFMLLTTLILDSESNSLQVVKNNIFSGVTEEIEAAPERVIPTDGKGELKSASEFKIVQDPGVFEYVPSISEGCIQTVKTVDDETEPSTGNQLPIGPAEEPKKFKVVLATISDSEPSPLLIPSKGTEEDLSAIKHESKERSHNEPMNMMTEMFKFVQEVSTAKKENKDQPKDERLPCPKSNDNQVEGSKNEHVQEMLEVPPAIISDLKAECSAFPEKDMILKDETGATITFCDSAPFTEGSVQTPKHLKTNIVQDQDIFKAVPVTILDLEPSSPQSDAIDQGSEDLPAEETLKSDLKEKTLSFTVDDVQPVKSPMVKDIEVVDVEEKATLNTHAITKYISHSKHELEIEPEPQDNAELVEEITAGDVKEEHLVQEVDDLAVGLEVESYTLPKNREKPANLPGKAVIEELKEKSAPNSSEIKSFQKFSETAETFEPNSKSITQSLKTKNTSQNNQEGQRSRDEILQEETQTEIPIVLSSDERENLTKVEPNSTPEDAQSEATSAQETGQKKEALEMNQITESCSPDFKYKHEREVESAHTKQTVHKNDMPSFTDKSNISHVPENIASSEEIPEKCKNSGRGSAELTNDRILSEIEIHSDKEKDNRPQVVRIKTAAVEPAEMPQYNTNDVIPDTVIVKLSEIQLPLIAGITGETAFQQMMETVTPSAPEAITQTAEEVRETIMMHVQSVEFDDIQEIQVQVKNLDTDSARTAFEPTLEVGFKEINDICQETISEAETSSAKSEIKDEVIHEENNATFHVVVPTKVPPKEMHESNVDCFETPRKNVDTVTDVSDQVEDENKGVEAVVEDNTKMFTEIHTERPEDIVQTCETPQSSGSFIHEEVLGKTKGDQAKYEVDASAEATTCSSKEIDIQKLQTVDSNDSQSVGAEDVSQNTGVIPTAGDIESKPSFPESSKPPTGTETPLKRDEVSETSVNTYDSDWLFKDTHTKECEQQIETTVQKTDLGEQESTEKAMVTNQPQEVKGIAIKTEELEEEVKSTETPTLDVQASDSIQRMSQREMTKEELIQLELSWLCEEKTVTGNLHSETEEDNDQEVWQDAMEDILTPEESDLAHSELQEKTEVEFQMSLFCKMEDKETQELSKTEEKGDTESEDEDFDVALEQLDVSRCH